MKRFFRIFLAVLLILSLATTVAASGGEAAGEQPNFLIALGIGLAVAGIVIFVMCYSMNNSRRQGSARHYLVPGTYRLRTQQDIYLYSHVSKRARPKNNNSKK